MIFLNRGGYDGERADAAKLFEVGKPYRVVTTKIGTWASRYTFEGVPGSHNTVMFEFADLDAILSETEEQQTERTRQYDENFTYLPRDKR